MGENFRRLEKGDGRGTIHARVTLTRVQEAWKCELQTLSFRTRPGCSARKR
jgi:hypothetical protein